MIGLYRGLSSLLYFSVPKVATRFFAFELMRNNLQGPDGKLTAGRTLLAGLGAGAAEAIVAGALAGRGRTAAPPPEVGRRKRGGVRHV